MRGGSSRGTDDRGAELAAIVESSYDGIIGKTLDGVVTSWNAGCERMYGYSAGEAVGQPATLIVPPELIDEEVVLLERVRRGERVLEHETVRITKDGGRLDVLLSVTPIVGPDGAIVGAASIQRDISRRKQMERALRESEERYRTVVEALAEGITLYDDRGRLIACNAAAERILGLPAPELLSRTPTDRPWHAIREDGSAYGDGEHPTLIALRTGEPQTRRIVGLRRPDGRVTWISSSSRPLLRDGRPYGVVNSFVDISEQRQAEQRIAGLTRLYAMLAATNEMVVRTQDRQRVFEEVCRIAIEVGGLLLAWVGLVDDDGWLRPVAVAGPAADYVEGLRVSARDVREGRGPTGTAVREGAHVACPDVADDPQMEPWRRQALAHGFHSLAAFPLRAGGRVVGALTVYAARPRFFVEEETGLFDKLADDVSFALDAIDAEERRRRAESELRQLSQELERRVGERTAELESMNAELEAFSSSVSHDLRAPLRAVTGFSQILLEQQGGALSKQGREDLRRVQVAAKQMEDLIEGLLRLSRVLRVELVRRPVDLSALAREILAELARNDPQRAVEAAVEEDISAQGDPALLHVVLENLLGNAWKFTGRREHARIEFGTCERDGQPFYFVRDDGVGFDMRHAAKLFVAFQRLHAEREFPGSGIGLATVERIVRRHGGRVSVEAEPGRGATFFFSLG